MLNSTAGGIVGLPLAPERVTLGNQFVEPEVMSHGYHGDDRPPNPLCTRQILQSYPRLISGGSFPRCRIQMLPEQAAIDQVNGGNEQTRYDSDQSNCGSTASKPPLAAPPR